MNAHGSNEHLARSPSRVHPGASPAAPVTHRLDYIDGLRALAALWVAAHHTIETCEPTRLMSLAIVGPVVSSLFFGQFPVMVFLMLSGFCLYYPYVRKKPRGPEFTTGYRAFLKRRATRIAPPYLWAGAFCLVMAAIPALQVGFWRTTSPVTVPVVLTHLLFIHNLIPSHATKIDYPMWSIGLEWQLYLLFPLLMWAFRKSSGAVVVVVTLAIAAAIRVSYRRLPGPLGAALHDGPFSYLEIFAAGMLAAALTVEKRRLAPAWLLGGLIVGGLAVVRLGTGNGLAHDLATSVAAFAVLQLAIDPESVVSRALSAPRLVQVGIFSYSIYLVHAPLLHLCWLALGLLGLSPEAMFAILVFAGLPLIVTVSYGFHCLFERPFMRTKLTQPIAPRPSEGGA